MCLLQADIEEKNILPSIVGLGGIIIVLLAIAFLIFFVFARNRQNYLVIEQLRLNELFQKEILRTQLEMQEQTFNIISQEIHDNVGQVLSLTKVQLHILEQGDKLDKILIADLHDSVNKAITDLRDIAKSLNSDRIQLSSLIEIISDELKRINRSGLLLTHLQIEGKEQPIQDQKKLVLFRIVQEALQNILKHSKASNVIVSCMYKADCLNIKVTDNGKGFDKDAVIKKEGLGLQNMLNRAKLIGGAAQIESTINGGTTITIIIPYA